MNCWWEAAIVRALGCSSVLESELFCADWRFLIWTELWYELSSSSRKLFHRSTTWVGFIMEHLPLIWYLWKRKLFAGRPVLMHWEREKELIYMEYHIYVYLWYCVIPAGGEAEALWKAVHLVQYGSSCAHVVTAVAWQPLPLVEGWRIYWKCFVLNRPKPAPQIPAQWM